MNRSFLYLVLALFSYLFASVATAESFKPIPLAIGQPAPPFDLPGIDDKNYRLDDFKEAQVLAVLFTANHCPTAQAYEKRIVELHNDYQNKDFALVAISPNDNLAVRLDELGYSDLGDSLEDMQLRAAEQGFTFPYLYDGDTQIASKAYGVLATPHIFIFDQERKLRYQGRIDNSESGKNITSHDARNAIDALLAGKTPPIQTTRAFGCSTKWSDKRGSLKTADEKWSKKEVTLESVSASDIRELTQNDSENLRLINLWATWCGPCVSEFPELVKISRMYQNRPFELITLSVDAPGQRDGAHRFLKSKQAAMKNYIFDSEDRDALAEALDPNWEGPIPYTILVKPGGEIIYRHHGEIDPLEVRRAIVGYLGRVYSF